MTKRKFSNKAINIIWVILVIFILLVFFKDRLSSLPELFKRLKKEPQKLVSVFKPRDMTGFSCSFNNRDDLEIWKTNTCRLQVIPSLFGTDDSWAKVTYFPAGTPGLLLSEETIGTMDWRRADAFSFRAYNPQSWSISLKVKVKDSSGNKYQKDVMLPPRQVTAVKIPIAEIASRLDASRITYLNLFLWDPSTETIIYYTDFAFPSPGHTAANIGLVKFMGLSFPANVRAGEEVEGAFYFLLNQKLSGDNILILRLRQGDNLYPIARIPPPFPTGKWRVKQLQKIGPIPITIPAGLAPGTYQLEAALAQPVPSGDGMEYIFQPYDNEEIEGYIVTDVSVIKNVEE
jgi:hypothetical protein